MNPFFPEKCGQSKNRRAGRRILSPPVLHLPRHPPHLNRPPRRARRRGSPCLPCAKAAQCSPRSKYPWGAPRNDKMGLSTRSITAFGRDGGRDVDPPHPRCSSVGGDAHAVERSGTSTLGVHRPAVFASYSGQTESSAPTHVLMCRVSVPCLSLWERWPSAARTERANHDHSILLLKRGREALSVTCGDSSPKGRAKGLCPVI